MKLAYPKVFQAFLGGCALVVALLLGVAQAQTSRGTITGLVSDPSGASIAGASVTLTNIQTGIARSVTTNESGVYRFDAVDPGNYTLKVSAQGFTSREDKDFQVAAGQIVKLDSSLTVGKQEDVVEVSAGAGAILQTQAAVRGGSIESARITQLPVIGRNPVALTLTLPGVSSNRFGFGVGTFSVNGSRGRSNNFLIDGIENNDISVAGQAFQITNPDAVQEVAVQTSNFDSEFGRAGGAVVNVVTKAGTNEIHGSLSSLLDSTRDDSRTFAQKVAGVTRVPPRTEQWYSGTIGGPIIKNRTFFFFAWQEQRINTTANFQRTAPSAAGFDTLRRLFPAGSNANIDTYLSAIGSARATTNFSPRALGPAPGTNAARPDIEFGVANVSAPQAVKDRQWQLRLDHRLGDKDQLSGRYLYSTNTDNLSSFNFPGLSTSFQQRIQNGLVTETHVFSPSVTNEARLSYNRIAFGFPADPPNPLGETLPQITIAGLSVLGTTSVIGVASNLPQGRVANNYTFQDTLTYIRGNHSFRFGGDVLVQRSRQFAPFAVRGTLTYNASDGRTGLGNFVDNFGGSGGSASRDFGSPAYYPDLVRQAYFAQDRWRATESLTLTFGLRYEQFGNPVNSLRTPAFSGLFNIDPVTFTGPYTEPNKVANDNNNFSPMFAIAYNPSFREGVLGWVLGDRKSVFRGGFQMGYDSFFNNIASNAQSSTPNLVSTNTQSVVSAASPRGLANFSAAFPATARAPIPLDSQTLVDPNLVNPVTYRWSFGMQRELMAKVVLDVSYVGSRGLRLFTNQDLNPLVPSSLRRTPTTTTPIPASRLSGRLDNLQGPRTIRTNAGDSIYHSLQVNASRRFANNFTVTGSYTFSKLIDNASEIFATDVGGSLSQTPAPFGGQGIERAVSLFDRTHRGVISYVYDFPFMREQKGALGRIVGGWQVSGVTTFESGVPYTIFNGVDADGFGGSGADRPDFNPNGRPGVRAVPNATSPTGFVNPDAANAPINPADAQYIGRPAFTGTAPLRGGNLGRNSERTRGTNIWNFNVLKTVKLTERTRMEFRTEFFNLFNTPQFDAPSATVFTSPSREFLNEKLTSVGRLAGGARVVRYQLKFIF